MKKHLAIAMCVIVLSGCEHKMNSSDQETGLAAALVTAALVWSLADAP